MTARYYGLSGATKVYYGSTLVWSGGSHDYSQDYLTFEILSGGTLNWGYNDGTLSKQIFYSLNNGEWTEIPASTDIAHINVNAGDIIRFKGDTLGTGSGTTDASRWCGFQSSTAYYNVYGNVLSLASSTGFTSGVTLTNSFKGLFRQTNMVDASNLYLPAPTVAFQYRFCFKLCTSLIAAPPLAHISSFSNYCFGGMFEECTSLTTAPSLPVVTTEQGTKAFSTMFNGCSQLAYVKDISTVASGDWRQNWLRQVASTGTFVQKSGVTWPSGDNGIPSNWTIVYE